MKIKGLTIDVRPFKIEFNPQDRQWQQKWVCGRQREEGSLVRLTSARRPLGTYSALCSVSVGFCWMDDLQLSVYGRSSFFAESDKLNPLAS